MANSTPVQSIERAFSIIESLAQHPKGMALMDLSEAVGLHKSTVYRMLASLTSMGYVKKDEQPGCYRLTIRMFELGACAMGNQDLIAVARPHLEQLARVTGEAVHLVVPEDTYTVYVDKLDAGSGAFRMASRIGLRNNMYSTATGKSILASLSPARAEEILMRSHIVGRTPNTITTLDGLFRELELVQKIGYAVDNEENELGVRCVGAAVCDYSTAPVAAISVSAPAMRMDDQRVSQIGFQVLKTAAAISSELGCPS